MIFEKPFVRAVYVKRDMATPRNEMINILREEYPNMFLRTTEEFDGTEGGIWTSGEDELPAKDGLPLFEYYAQDMGMKKYEFGVHKEMRTLLEKHGWRGEWNDPGTIMLWDF